MQREPLITAAAITAIVATLLTLLQSLGMPITAEQQESLNQMAAILAPIVVALLARRYLTPVVDARDDTGEELVRKVDGAQPVAKARR